MAKKKVHAKAAVQVKRAAPKKAGPARKTAKKPVKPTGKTLKKSAPPARKSVKKPARKTVASKAAGKTVRKAPPKKTASAPARKRAVAREYRGVREALLRLRERITGQIDFLATENLNRSPNDGEINFRSEEQGTDNFERDLALTRVSSEQDLIFEIDEAINRLDIGTYGICEQCACVIGKPRMLALPYSRMCVACQSLSESGRRSRTAETRGFMPMGDRNIPDLSADDD